MSLAERVERARRLLAQVEKNYSPSVLACGFGAEDMVVLDLIARDGLALGIFTLDTGRLPGETHALAAQVRDRYGLTIDTFAPWPDSVDAFVEDHGFDGIYDGPAPRAACCAIRKAEPLRRALARKRGCIVGLRAETTPGLMESALDPVHGVWRFAPLAGWSEAEVWSYLRDNGVPHIALHDRGYRFVDCAPCTTRGGSRAVPVTLVGRPPRALPEATHG